MAYYNPDQQEGYYNPYASSNASTGTGALGETIKNMAILGGLNIIGNALTHKMSGGAKNIMRKMAQKQSGLGKLARGAQRVTDSVSTFKSNVKQTLSGTKFGKAYNARKELLKPLKGKEGYAATSFASAFKNKTTFAASAAGVWKKNVLQGMAVAYTVDSMLGFTADMGLKKKAIYDIPGQVGNFGKWLAVDSVAGMAMGGALRALPAMGAVGMKAAGKAFGGSFGKSVAKAGAAVSGSLPSDGRYANYFKQDVADAIGRSNHQKKFATDIVSKGLHFAQTVRDSSKAVASSLYTVPKAATDSWNQTGSWRTAKKTATNVLETAFKQVKEIAQKPRRLPSSSHVDTTGLRAMEFLDTLSQSKISASEANLANTGLSKMFIPEFKRLASQKSLLQKVFTFLEPIKNRDIASESWINRVAPGLQSRFGKDKADMLMSNVLNMKSGDNLYRDWRGGKNKGAGVDLGAFDPIHVMRRAASFIANHKFGIPFTNSNGMSLAELTGTTRYLSKSPDFEFFNERPQFQFRNGSIGDISHAKAGEPTMFMYMNGKYASFDNEGIHVADSKRKLYYSPRTSKDKSFELKTIAVNRLKDSVSGNPEKAAERFSAVRDKVDHYQTFDSKWANFLDRRGIGWPSKIQELAGALNSKLNGNKHYSRLTNSLFGNDKLEFELAHSIPLLDNTLASTTQVLSKVSRDPAAVAHMANFVQDKFSRDLLGKLNSGRPVVDLVEEALVGDAAHYANRSGFQRALQEAKAYPKESLKHNSVARMGSLSEMKSEDILRTHYIDDIFNKSFETHIGKGNAHPLLAAIPGLEAAGKLTTQEAKDLSLHAKLSVFRQLDGMSGAIVNAPESATSVLNKVRQRAKTNQWEVTNEITDFVQSHGIKDSKIGYEQQRILNQHLLKAGFTSADLSVGTSPYFSAPQGLAQIGDLLARSMDSTTDLMAEVLPFKKRFAKHHGILGGARFVGGIMATTGLAFGAYKVADTVVAANPLFDNTALDDGVTGFGADQIARGRMAMAKAGDLFGVTDVMKYMHGLAPGSETTLPGMVAGGVIGAVTGGGIGHIAKGLVVGAIANRMASPYLPDMTKTHEELTEIYSGRAQVPIMKSPTWLLGGTPWQGSKVEGWSPNWYVRAKSRYKETNTMYGSAFRKLIHEPLPLVGMNIGDVLDPYYMERKHFFSRPAPLTGGAFDEVPIIGKPLSATIGRIVKPQKTMHQEFLTSDLIKAGERGDPYPFAIRPPTVGEGQFAMQTNTMSSRSSSAIANDGGTVSIQPNKRWTETASEDFLYDVSHFAGLKGFVGGTISDRIFDGEKVRPTLESAGRIASMSRSYHDMNLGGMGVITEPIRRLIDKPEYKQYGVNPIPNLMPNWLPSNFLTGDPYTKILRGELRLPGKAYATTHTSLTRSMPARASMVGGRLEDITSYFSGNLSPMLKETYDIVNKGTEMHEQIQDTLAAEGLLIQAEALVFDVKNNITGHVDAIIRGGKGGGGRKALEIKSINDKGFKKLDGPKYQHVGQLNFYLKELKMNQGQILYVNRQNPLETKLYDIRYSQSRWEKDFQKLRKSREAAQSMLESGVEDDFGYSYSWIDRLSILADVAPSSKEFKEVKSLVEKQIKFGVLTDNEVKRYKYALKNRQARIRKYELYPDRFRGKVLSPDTEVNIQSINEDIKAGADYSVTERAVGAMWEHFTNTNSLLTNKLFAFKDPMEHYKMTRMYGKEYKPWDEPIRSFMEPYSRGLASKTDPLGGALSYGTGGFVLGGGSPVASLAGAGFGAAYGMLHGMYRFATNSTYVPDSIQEKRDIVSYFDAAKYAKSDMLSQLTAGSVQQKFIASKAATLTSVNEGGGDVGNLFRATPYTEKPYIESFLNTRNSKERSDILKYIPEDLGRALTAQWHINDERDGTSSFVERTSADIAAGAKRPAFNKSVLDPGVQLEDVQLKTIESRGMDAHEFGLGWNEQMLRMQQTRNQVTEVKRGEMAQVAPENPNLNSGHIRGVINNLCRKSGVYSKAMVYIHNNSTSLNTINLTVRTNKSRVIINSIRNRNRYM